MSAFRYDRETDIDPPWLSIDENNVLVNNEMLSMDEFKEHCMNKVNSFCENMKIYRGGKYSKDKIENEWFNLFFSWLH